VIASPDVDSAIDRLNEALRTAGLAALEPPSDVTPIAEVDAAVAPYALPRDLRRFWERVDADRIGLNTFPKVGGPAAVLHHQRLLREIDAPFPLAPPPIFLTVDYASHCYGLIELESPWTEGGTILEWDMGEFPLVSRSVADWIELVRELVSEGSYERSDGYVVLDHRAEQEKRFARLEASGPHPLYGHLHAIPGELELWPAHWLAASGIDLCDRVPRGATHTIAELVAAAGEGPVTGRIHGNVTVLVGSGAGMLVAVDDGTRPLEVWCPTGTSPWGPVHQRRFELEVTVDGDGGPGTAAASDVRPLD
jgi:hypothetical protein